MRKQQLTQFVSLLVLGVAAAAQTPSQLDRVNVVRGTDDIRVEMRSNGKMTPKLSTLDSPARIVVDLPETVMATGQRRIAVGKAGVKGVRIGTDGQTPPTTRIVVDLDQALTYDLTPGPAGKLVLTLHENALAKAAAAEAKTVAISPVSTGKPMSPFAPRVMDAKSASKAASVVKPTADATAPNDFVFVEPSYQAKNETKPETKTDEAASEPTVRAQEAALLADRSDVSEELIRLKTHTGQVDQLLQADGEVGKKLDFLLQEMNREANTILSKTGGLGEMGLTITELALAAKSEIDKIREQSLNLE